MNKDDIFEHNKSEVYSSQTKFRIHTPIIIAGIIFLMSVIVYLSLTIFFDSSIIGTWTLENQQAKPSVATLDEVKVASFYFTFEPDGIAKMCFGTVETRGNYTIAKNSDNNLVANINIPNGLTGKFTVRMYGNKVTGRQLELENDEKLKVAMDSSVPYKRTELKSISGFKIDKEILGTWKDETYNVAITFNEDGTMIINEEGIVITHAVYSVIETNLISFKFDTVQSNESKTQYMLNKETNILEFAEGSFKKVETKK